VIKPYYERDGIEIYHGDCLEIMPQLDRKFDLILTDPPYGIGYDRNAKHFGKVKNNKVFGDDAPFDPSLLLKYDKLILWGANCYASRLPDCKTWIAWHKTLTTNNDGQTADFELAWANCISRSRHFTYLWAGCYRAGENKDYYHPTQKPVALMKFCVDLSKTSGIVFDPFLGSGTTLVAAAELKRQAVGIEICEKYCEISAKRIERVLNQGTLEL
jgi:site-specific DNA-methyltransferase (adenine-specific)